MENVLKTINISKSYKKHLALNNVSITVNKGDIYGLVGKNGSGKTTLIRAICGLIRFEGSYTLFGINNNDPKIYAQKRRMSAVVEAPSIALDLNAFDNIRQTCILLGIKDPSVIQNTLKLVGLEDVDKKKLAKNYSLGMKQRLGIGIALVSNPDFIILDEPMNGLDPQGIVQLRELILTINQEKGVTFIISSHLLSELSKIATKYGFINDGKLLTEITAAELQDKANKRITLTINKTTNISPVLETELKINKYKINNDHQIEIYQDTELPVLITTLNEKGFVVTDIQTYSENIEEFYLNLIGGEH